MILPQNVSELKANYLRLNQTLLVSTVQPLKLPPKSRANDHVLASAGPGQSPAREISFAAPAILSLVWGPPGPFLCSGSEHASVEARQTSSSRSSMTRNNSNCIFCLSLLLFPCSFLCNSAWISKSSNISTSYAPENIFLCPLSSLPVHSPVPVRLHWHCVGIAMMLLCHLPRHVMTGFCVVLMWKFTLCSVRCIARHWRRRKKECIMNWRNRTAVWRLEDI